MYQWNYLQNIPEGQTEINENSKEVLGSTHSCGHLFVITSDNVEFISPGRYSGGCFLKLILPCMVIMQEWCKV